MKIFTRELGIASTNTFLFINEAAGKAVVFDAPEGSFDWVCEVLEREELTLEALYSSPMVITITSWMPGNSGRREFRWKLRPSGRSGLDRAGRGAIDVPCGKASI